MESERQENPSENYGQILTELKLTNQLLLKRVEDLEKEVRRLKYILITVIFAIQSILPDGLGALLDLLNKTP